jgi:hypothetical protein
MNDLQRIDARIAELRAELDRLEIARSVLSELHAAAPTLPPKGKANGAAFTVRRVEAPAGETKAPAAKASGKPKDRAATAARKAKVRQKVMAQIEAGPVKSGDIIRKLHLREKSEKQEVYQALYDLNSKGLAVRDENAFYTLVTPPSTEQPGQTEH